MACYGNLWDQCIHFIFVKTINSNCYSYTLYLSWLVFVDNYFYLNRKEIELRNDKYVLNIDSNYEGTVVYTDNFEDDVKSILSDRRNHRSVAIEPQDAQTNRRELQPGEVYEKYIRLAFNKL